MWSVCVDKVSTFERQVLRVHLNCLAPHSPWAELSAPKLSLALFSLTLLLSPILSLVCSQFSTLSCPPTLACSIALPFKLLCSLSLLLSSLLPPPLILEFSQALLLLLSLQLPYSPSLSVCHSLSLSFSLSLCSTPTMFI